MRAAWQRKATVGASRFDRLVLRRFSYRTRMMTRSWLLVSALSLLAACQGAPGGANDDRATTCPEPPAEPIALATATANRDGGIYSEFDYRIRDIVADADQIRFQSLHYDFVFCRGDESWTVQTGTYEPEPELVGEAYQAELANPTFQTLAVNGETYQYRVQQDPNPFADPQARPEQVVFELKTPDSETPRLQPLYSRAAVETAGIGVDLGVPRVAAALATDERLLWAIASEQGEGFNGITTLVSYEPARDELSVIQPEAIAGQQINDLALAGPPEQPTLWLGTQIQGEGNPYLPGLGLVAYRPDSPDLKSGTVQAYHRRNSPLVGAIASQLFVENDTLWVGTGNGICRVQWPDADTAERWQCWRVALFADLPGAGLPLFATLPASEPATTLTGDRVEVLWRAPLGGDPEAGGRYEVRSDEGFTVTVPQGWESWPESQRLGEALSPLFWPGREWHWAGDRFERGFDAVALNYFGGGPLGIGQQPIDYNNTPDLSTMRGDLELLDLTPVQTTVRHYSGWVEEAELSPYLTLVPDAPPAESQPNPLTERSER